MKMIMFPSIGGEDEVVIKGIWLFKFNNLSLSILSHDMETLTLR